MNPHVFRKLPECSSCQFYSINPLLPCTVHPYGAEGDRCIDYRPDPDYDENDPALAWFTDDSVEDDTYRSPFGRGDNWEPAGAAYYNGELVLQPEQRRSPEELIELLDTHPLFTGRCPNCGRPIPQAEPPRVHWDCPFCEWKDDSV